MDLRCSTILVGLKQPDLTIRSLGGLLIPTAMAIVEVLERCPALEILQTYNIYLLHPDRTHDTKRIIQLNHLHTLSVVWCEVDFSLWLLDILDLPRLDKLTLGRWNLHCRPLPPLPPCFSNISHLTLEDTIKSRVLDRIIETCHNVKHLSIRYVRNRSFTDPECPHHLLSDTASSCFIQNLSTVTLRGMWVGKTDLQTFARRLPPHIRLRIHISDLTLPFQSQKRRVYGKNAFDNLEENVRLLRHIVDFEVDNTWTIMDHADASIENRFWSWEQREAWLAKNPQSVR